MSLSLGKKIAFGQFIAFMFFISFASVVIYYLYQINTYNVKDVKINFTHYRLSQKTKLHVVQIQQYLSDIGATRGEDGLDDGLEEAKKNYEELLKNLQEENELAAKENNTAMIAKLEEIKKFSEVYYSTGVRMANLYIKEGTKAGNTFMPNFDQASLDLQQKVDSFLNEATNNFAKEIEKISDTLSLIFKIAIYFPMIVLVIYSIFSFKFIKNLTLQIINVSEELSATTPKLISSADSMSSLSEELSSCATEQAAAVQETAASIEEISAMISKNSDNANNAKISSLESLNSVKAGQKAIHEMLIAMNEISKNNESLNQFIDKNNTELNEMANVITNIAEKTKIINDIVFQTKLLSFNASVEAARAGEQGKGFAVVAQEIGNLAQMSGNAANEIKSELDSSIKKVNDIVTSTKLEIDSLMRDGKEKIEIGNEKAEYCNTLLNEINHSSQTAESLVVEVANASKEQSQGISEVNKAMGQIDEVTGQNSLASERVSTTASQVLELSNTINSGANKLLLLVKGQQV
nr:methyl-accepting chemotaxis protein [Bacteriovorax sp. HI3]